MENIKIYNATELWHRENQFPSIPSFSQSLDSILGHNGVQLCSLTEVLGLPGTGKTQICIQLCASIQIPRILGGLNAEALYIDTNTNFTVQRFKEVLFASLHRCQQLLDTPFDLQEDEALKKLHYVNAFGLEKFCAFMMRLPKFIAERPNVKLIVIDSLPFPFKDGVFPKKRTGLLFRIMADLQKLTMDKHIAVLVTNEMSTRVGLSGGAVVGALGDAWAHRCNARVLLAKDGGRRYGLLLKSTTAPAAVAGFQITQEGIRDED